MFAYITCAELNHFSSQQFGLAEASAHSITDKGKNKIGENSITKGFKSIFVPSKHKIKCSITHTKYFQPTNAVDTRHTPFKVGYSAFNLVIL